MVNLPPLIEEYRKFIETIKQQSLSSEFLGVVHNESILTYEILTNFNYIWSTPSVIVMENNIPAASYTTVEGGKRGRITSVTKSGFNTIMSMFELDLKKFIFNTSDQDLIPLQTELNNGKRIPLSTILYTIKKAGLITECVHLEILGITRVRNVLVHNNAIPDDLDVDISIRQMFRKYEVGKEILAETNVFLDLIKKVLNFYNNWHISQKITYDKFDIR